MALDKCPSKVFFPSSTVNIVTKIYCIKKLLYRCFFLVMLVVLVVLVCKTYVNAHECSSYHKSFSCPFLFVKFVPTFATYDSSFKLGDFE